MIHLVLLLSSVLLSYGLEITQNSFNITESEKTIDFTVGYDYGGWELIFTKINGTSTVRFCTSTLAGLNAVTNPAATTRITSGSCYKKGTKYTITVLGASINNSVKVDWIDSQYATKPLQLGKNLFNLTAAANETLYYKFTVSGSNPIQFFLTPGTNAKAVTYTLRVIKPSCTQNLVITSASTTTALANSVESGNNAICLIENGDYFAFVTSSSATIAPGEFVYIYYNSYSNNIETIGNDVVKTFNFYETTFLKYIPSAPVTQIRTYRVDVADLTNFGAVNINVNGVGIPLCTPGNVAALRVSSLSGYQPEQPTANIDSCGAVKELYFSVTPVQPANRTDLKTGNVSIKITETVIPSSQSVSLGTKYSVDNTVKYYVLDSGSVPQGQFLTLTIYNGTTITVYINRGVAVNGDGQCQGYNEQLTCAGGAGARCNYTVSFPTCYFNVDSGNFYIVITNTANDTGVSLVINSQSTTQDSSSLLAENVTISGIVPGSGHKYLTFDNIPPSIFKISNLATGILSSLTARIQDADSIQCFDTTSNINPSGTLNLRVICPKSGVIVLSSPLVNTDISFTAIRNPLKTESFTNQKLSAGPFPNEPGATSVVSSFNISPKSSLSWTVTATDPTVRLRFDIYQKGSCKAITNNPINCYQGYPCYFYSTDLDGDYNLVVRDAQQTVPGTVIDYNFTVSYIYGNSQCRNITNELVFCKGNLSTSDTYQLNTIDVPGVEALALANYNTLALSWSVDACNGSIWGYACKSTFQPHLCTDTGSITKSLLCKQQCLDTLAPKCLTNESPNLCEEGSCSTASNNINQCRSVTPPPPPSGSGTLVATLFVTLLSIYLLRMFN